MFEQYPLHFEFRANQTFDDFFAGINQPIVDSLKQSILAQGEQQIFLWGKTGQGKTHLLQACCHYAQLYEQQSFYFDLSLYHKFPPEILTGLDNYDVVCIDHIDSIAGNVEWEKELCRFMQRHIQQKHCLILSSTDLPDILNLKTNELRMRLNWGAIVQLQTMVDTESIDALIFKAETMGFEITPQIGRFLILDQKVKIDELWELLKKLDHASLAAKRKLTLPFLKELFRDQSLKTQHN